MYLEDDVHIKYQEVETEVFNAMIWLRVDFINIS